MKNIEIKVRVGKRGGGLHGLARKALVLGARREGVLQQTDTYYRVPEGRLKLRETRGAQHAELIFYTRPNKSGSKTSAYEIYHMPALEVSSLKRFFANVYGILVVVKKRRDLYLYKHTRIHLDHVTGIPDHAELETVVGKGSMANYRKEHAVVITALGLDSLPSVPVSYSDLLLKTSRRTG